MLVNILIIIFLIIIVNQLFLASANSNTFGSIINEGFMSVIGPVITPIYKPNNKPINQPTDTYYVNNKVTQDFDEYSVIQDYNPNSIFIQEDYDSDSVLTTGV